MQQSGILTWLRQENTYILYMDMYTLKVKWNVLDSNPGSDNELNVGIARFFEFKFVPHSTRKHKSALHDYTSQ